MFQKLLLWVMGFMYRRKAKELLAFYDQVQAQDDRTVWIGSFFIAQESFLKSSALKRLYVNKLPVQYVYIYYSLEETLSQYKGFLTQIENNGVINVSALQEFQVNSTSLNIHQVLRNDVPILDQLLEVNDILNRIIMAYNKQTASVRSMNLSRMIPLFEMHAIIVNRVTLGYLATS